MATTNSNKFDYANHMQMMMNPQQYFGMMNPMMQNFQQFIPQETTESFSKITLEETSTDDAIIKQLEYYFSIENLNVDYFLRSKMNEEGFLNAKEIINFKKMKAFSVSIEKIQNILQKFNTVIESQVTEGELFLRNKNWDTIKDKITPLSDIKEKKSPTVQNTNYFHLQNNFYYNVPPQFMMSQGQPQPFMPMPSMMGYQPHPFQSKQNYSN